MKKITIRDLAAETNLSITQVSKALNGYPDVSPITKQLVIDKAAELGYVPNKGARSLASKKQTEITVLNLSFHSNISENIFLVLKGIYAESDKYNMKVSVDFISSQVSDNISLANYIIQNSIETPIIIGLSENHPYYEQINEDSFKFKCVVLDNMIEKENVINVNVDDNLGVDLVSDYFLKKNFKKILIVGADFNSYVNNSRREAVKQKFTEKGLKYQFINGEYDYEIAKKELLEHRDYLKDTDAVFCFSDIMAVGVNAAMHELKIHRPIVGFDGLEITNYVYPKISTVSQSFSEKGVKIVKAIIENNTNNHDIVVKPVLIKR